MIWYIVETLPAKYELRIPETKQTETLAICSFAPEWIILSFDLHKL